MATFLPSSSVLILTVFLLLGYAASAIDHLQYKEDDLFSEEKLQELFEHWLHRHGKNYSAPSQKRSRFEIFKQNLIYIHHRNQGPHSHKLGLNQFADLTLEEFRRTHLGLRRPPVMPPSDLLRQRRSACHSVPPPAVDWRQHGAVTPVKNQGGCGSCWAFSSVGAIEGAHAVATGKLVSLSEQELVSCVPDYGCDGGLMDPAFDWVIKNGGINTEAGYPYASGQGGSKSCSLLKRLKKVVSIDSYVDVTPHDESALLCAVAQQPVSVAINAGGYDFQLYSGGVFHGSCSSDPNDVDHAVLVVGYGSEKGKDYWIVKNSWGKPWGLDGYVHIQRNAGNSNGVCGILTMPSYPVAKGSSSGSVSTM